LVTSLSTHVLDLAAGQPAAGVAVRLYRRDEPEPRLVAERLTSGDGRARLLDAGELTKGPWRLAFDIGAYFAGRTPPQGDAPFLDVVVVDFGVADASAPHHIPLLASPFGYSTYRGS
jgi:5-hydroxyisourate hydrolase